MYKEDTGKYYYIINGKRKYVKVPEGVSSKNLARINIQNIIKLPSAQRMKKQGKLRQPKFGKKIVSSLQKDEQAGLPLYVFKPGKKIKTLEDLSKESDDTSVEKITKLLLKGIEAIPSSSKVQPTIVSGRPRPALPASESKEANEPPEGLLGKKKKGRKTGKEPDIRPSELAKILYSELGVNGEYPSLEEANNLIPSKYGDLTQVQYDNAIELAAKQALSDEPKESFMSKLQKRIFKNPAKIVPAETETEVEGAGYDGEGLFNDEIEKIAKKRIKDYVPVIASDQLNELPKYVARGDKRFGFVVNTNPSTSDGSGNDSYPPGHWTAVFINNEDDYPSIEFFDPLAQGEMPEDLIKMCRRIAVKMNPEVMFKYKQNMLRRQSKMTSNCGFHAVKYLDDRYNGVPYSEATGYDDYMESLNNAPDGSRDGEKEIASYIKKYESYI